LTPFIGTKFYEQVKDRLITHDWEKFDEYTPVLKLKYVDPQELEKLKIKAYFNYYFRAKWLFKHGYKVFLP